MKIMITMSSVLLLFLSFFYTIHGMQNSIISIDELGSKLASMNLKCVPKPDNGMWNNKAQVVEIHATIDHICTQLAQFHFSTFEPSARLFYRKYYSNDRDQDLLSVVDIFYMLFIQISMIMYIEHHMPLASPGLFHEDDWDWHQKVNLSKEGISEFIGSHSPQGLFQQAIVHLLSLRTFLKLMCQKTNYPIFLIAITKAETYINFIIEALTTLKTAGLAHNTTVLKQLQEIKPALQPVE